MQKHAEDRQVRRDVTKNKTRTMLLLPAALLPVTLLVAPLRASGLPPLVALRSASPPPRSSPPPRMGPGPSDLALIGITLVLVPFVGKSIFDSVFVEDETAVAPYPKLRLPFFGGDSSGDPLDEAEQLRQNLQRAVEARDMAAAFAAEKELKQFMIENGINFDLDVRADGSMVDDQPQGATELPFPQEIDTAGRRNRGESKRRKS